MSYKKIVLHPLDENGQPNEGISLFPDTLSSSLMKSDGETPFVPAEKEVVEDALDRKLNKIEGNANVYATSENGVDVALKWSEGAEAKSVARRTSRGTIKSANPTEIDDVATKDYVDDEISEVNGRKQDELVSGENIKTINGESVLGSGNIEIQGMGRLAVKDVDLSFSSDTLTAELKNAQGEVLSSDSVEIPLSSKQDVLTFDNAPTEDSTNPVTSGGVYTATEAIRAVAEGKCKSYTISIADNASFDSQNAALSGISSITDTAGNVVSASELHNGDVVLVIELDKPDRWYSPSDAKFYILETAKVDITNMVTTDTNQTITGTKTFSSAIQFDSEKFSIRKDGNLMVFKTNNKDGALNLGASASSIGTEFRPTTTGFFDLGHPSYKWKDLYLSGKIKDGTNEFNADNVFNVINASDIVSNTLTDAQYALITNGKPTLIKGNWFVSGKTYSDLFIDHLVDNNTYWWFIAIVGSQQRNLQINKSTRVVSQVSNYGYSINENGSRTFQASQINGKSVPNYPTTNTSPQVLTIAPNGGALSWADSSSGIPEATKAGQVLVSDSQLDPEWSDAAPMADNLVAPAITNDAMYSSGPTGGLADIAIGEEAYLNNIDGMTIIWNQLMNTSNVALESSHVYIVSRYGSNMFELVQNSSDTISYDSSTNKKIFDLTLMFGGNDKIPFSLSETTEYATNGNLPAQKSNAVNNFARLFANVDLENAPYDAGTPKNVKVTKLVEIGRNLWDASTMESTGCLLLSGYTYEIYLEGNEKHIMVYYNGSWHSELLTQYQRADGKYIWTFKGLISGSRYLANYLVKSQNGCPIKYIGFVHSGNYCLTTGSTSYPNYANTSVTIPAYHKYEFNISGIDGLNGLLDRTGSIAIADRKDAQFIGSMDLSAMQNDIVWDSDMECWFIDKANIPSNSDFSDESQEVILASDFDLNGNIVYKYNEQDEIVGLNIDNGDSVNKPTAIVFYPLATPIATGEDPFEPIPLKSGDNWIVDDMGSEYFIQPANTNCPVNQVSYYYENLKDKLANLQEPVLPEPISYSPNNTSLEGIKIGTESYKLLPLGNMNSNESIAVGRSAGANGARNVAIGYSASANSGGSGHRTAIGSSANAGESYATAIGSGAVADKPYSIALGGNSRNTVPDSLVIDTISKNRTYQAKSPSNIMFRFENINQFVNREEGYIYRHYLSEYITNGSLVENSGKYYISYTDASNYKTFAKVVESGTATDISASVTGVHITVEISGSTSHSIVGLDLKLYNSANSYGYDSYARVAVDGVMDDIVATMDSDGRVVITPPTGSTITSVTYNLK